MIDVHAHFLPNSLLDRVTAGALPGIGFDGGQRTIAFPSGMSRPVPHPLTELDERAVTNATSGIDVQVLSPWLDVTGDDLPLELAVRWTREMNDRTAEELCERPSFRAFAALPVSDGEAAAAELDRAIGSLGFVGAAIPTHVGGRNLDEVGLEPLFAEAARLGVPLFLHPFRVLGADRLARDFLANVCGNPFETTVAALSLFYDGVFDRHPELKVLLAHCGGALPTLAGRACRASTAGLAGRRAMVTPDEVLSCFTYDSVLHDPAALAFVVERVGAERVALGTDHPFPMLVPDPGQVVRDAVGLAGGGEAMFDRITSVVPDQLVGVS